jgi:phage/plasmid-like protein (TIGR03299 family)
MEINQKTNLLITGDVAERTFAILEGTGTNWQVNKLPLITAEGYQTESFGNFRSDNNSWLGTTKARYEVMNNHTLVEQLVQATEMLDLSVTNGGMLKGGRKVYYQIELPEQYIGKSNVKRQITALNSHDGSTCIGFGSSSTVVVCQNTFHKSMKEIDKVLHTGNSLERIKALAKRLKEAIIGDNKLMEVMQQMSSVPLRDEMIERTIRKLFLVDTSEKLEKVPTRTKNNIEAFADSLNTEIQLEGSTVWGLFNAVTRYTNHVAAPSKQADKDVYLMQGAGAKMNNLAFNELMQYIEKNSYTDLVTIERG